MLSLVFGCTTSVIDIMLKFGIHILDLVMQRLPEAEVRLPNAEEIKTFSGDFQNKYSLLTNVWGVLDCLKLSLESAGDSIVQNAYYNGWTHEPYPFLYGRIIVLRCPVQYS